MIIDDLREIVERNRQTGSTEWLLKSAAVNPNCYVVSRDYNNKRELARLYTELIVENEIFRQLHAENNSVFPKFVTMNEMKRMVGHQRLPVIFDSSCFF